LLGATLSLAAVFVFDPVLFSALIQLELFMHFTKSFGGNFQIKSA
jgi:hypothetical protein